MWGGLGAAYSLSQQKAPSGDERTGGGSTFTHLAVNENVSASTQNQALCALVFIYRYLLKQVLSESIEAVRAKRPKYLSVVLTVTKSRSLLQKMNGIPLLVA